MPETPLDEIFNDKSGRKRVTGPINFALDGKEETAWGTDAGPGRCNQPRKAVFTAAQPIQNPAGTLLTFYLQQNHGGWNSDDNQNHNLGRFRLSITGAPDAVADPLPAAVREVLAIPAAERTPAQIATVFSYWRTTVPEWHDANERIEALWKQHPLGASQLVLTARGENRATHVLERGDFLKPKAAVQPGVPDFLHPLAADAPPSRLGFARWLVDRRSPTTARSIVNRIWQGYFGIGLVNTSEDLGLQSETPSHPELLDWLAVELMDGGWRLKSLHRLIVTSSTYRQSSRITPEMYARDPYNRLLARGAALSGRCRERPRRGFGGFGIAERQSRRTERVSAGSRVPLQAARQLRSQELAREPGRRPLSPRPVYVPLSFGSLSDAADLRRAERRHCLRPPRAVEHAIASPDDAQRTDLLGMRPSASEPDAARRGRRQFAAAAICVSLLRGPRADGR